MTRQVIWTKLILEQFITQANLTKQEQMIMRTRCAGWSRVMQSMQFGMSLSCIDKCIARLKVKYDAVQKTSVLLPPRKHSALQTFMDTDGRKLHRKTEDWCERDCQDDQSEDIESEEIE